MILQITPFFQIQESIKIHHWLTDNYSLHVLLDDFLKDYTNLVDEIVENFLSKNDNSIEIVDIKPIDKAFNSLQTLWELANKSFDEVRQNIDKMPKGMRTILDEVESTMRKYAYLFKKF